MSSQLLVDLAAEELTAVGALLADDLGAIRKSGVVDQQGATFGNHWHCEPLHPPSARKEDASPSRQFQPPGGLMEPIDASLQRGR